MDELHTADEETAAVDSDREQFMTPATLEPPDVGDDLLDQVDRFIQRYRPALDRLATDPSETRDRPK